nr:RING finger protein 151-like [Pocillopora verrucosa]
MSGLSSFNVATEPGDVLDQSLLCPICKELMNQPVSMPCGHSACKTCLLEMISKQSIGSRPCTCPLCRARIEGDKLNVNVTVSTLIGRIQVRCTNVGCSWVGMHSEKETHMDTCPFMVIDCPNGPRGCLVKPERYALNLHIASCPFEKVPCFHCHIGVERSTLASHEDNCREIPRPCPLQCGEQLPRSHIHLHLGDCPQRVVKCTVKGCHNFYALEEEAEHDKQYQESHQVLLKQEVERLRGIIFDQADETVRSTTKRT